MTATSGGKPRAATISVDGGDNDGIANNDNGWFIDSTPYDSSEFQGLIYNAFSGDASYSPGNPASGRFDFYTVAAHEIAHAVGLGNQSAFTNLCTNTGIADVNHGGTGNYYVFRGASIKHLMTSYNSGSDSGVGKHSANTNSYVEFEGDAYYGALDIANAGSKKGVRNLVSNTLALMLRDAYGYDVNLPAQFQTMYATNSEATGQLLVRSGDSNISPPGSNDVIGVWFDGLDFNVSVNISNDVPGTGGLPGVGDLGPFVTKYRPFLFNNVTINTGAGTDNLFVENCAVSHHCQHRQRYVPDHRRRR